MQHQIHDQWCWAAVSTSVALYFHPASQWTQCSVANTALGQRTCCQNGGTAACNQPWYLDRALQIVGSFARILGQRATSAQVNAEINSSKPLCLRIGWNLGGGHFVAIYGYSGNFVNVADPWWGSSVVDFNSFPGNYQNGGAWTHTYWVKP
jgi:ABC-type bacteriocin/lantibiotic exporter with double-glycine peptidase domain